MPERFHLSRRKGWRMPENGRKVDRSTRWGNPWRILASPTEQEQRDGYVYIVQHQATGWAGRAGFAELYPAAEFAVERFRVALLHPFHPGLDFSCMDVRRELAGFDLGCWCHDDFPCHAAVLLEAANT